jgi:hypothetical protein
VTKQPIITSKGQMFFSNLSRVWNNIQCNLFPLLTTTIGPLSPEYEHLAAIFELIRVEDFIPHERFTFGRPLKDRRFIARAFIAKIFLRFHYTKHFLKHLINDEQLKAICGWDRFAKIPSASVFSRAFAVFATSNLPEVVHKALITRAYEGVVVGHVTRDSTPIHAREKFLKKEGTRQERKKKLNIKYRKEKKEGTSRKQMQLKQDLSISLNELPKACDIGSKKGSQGHITAWKGYKLHLAVDDLCVPLAAILTSASLNDSEAAIPLGEKAKGVTNLYDLMDSAYDDPEIKEHSISLGHVPLIDEHSRSKKQKDLKKAEKDRRYLLNFTTAEDRRYRLRFSKERSNALLKEYYGCKNIQVKGYKKVFCHVMFGVLALTASTIINSFS